MFAHLSAAALLLLPLVSSSEVAITPGSGNGVTYAVTIPSCTTSRSSCPVYFQISGPSSNTQWIGFGQSNDGYMKGANLFFVYAASNGNNVTLSPRHGLGEFQPKFDSSTQVTLLDGSGVANGKITANVRCDSCLKWDGGTLDTTDSNSKWIWSMKKGSALNTDDVQADLQQHSVFGDFTIDLTKAVDTSGASNPFSATASQSQNQTTPGGSTSGATEGSESSSLPESYSIAHGVLMASALVIIMPFGALLKRLGTGKRSALLSNPLQPENRFRSLPHAVVELFGTMEIIAGLGLGIYVGNKKNLTGKQAHTVLGLIIFAIVIFQSIGGVAAYWLFSKNRPTFVGRIHQWQGRLIFLLGIINGGLGIQLVGNDPTRATIVYAVIAAVAAIIYIAVILKWYVQQRKTRANEGAVRAQEKAGNGSGNGSH